MKEDSAKYALHHALVVGDPQMSYQADETIISDLVQHLKSKVDDHPCPGRLIYGCPGTGKTRLLYEFLLASLCETDRPTTLYTRLNRDGIDMRQWAVVAIAFNNVTAEDAHLCKISPDLVVWLRLFFTYCDHLWGSSPEGFDNLRKYLLRQLHSGKEDPQLFQVRALLELIRVKWKRPQTILLVDETLSLQNALRKSMELPTCCVSPTG